MFFLVSNLSLNSSLDIIDNLNQLIIIDKVHGSEKRKGRHTLRKDGGHKIFEHKGDLDQRFLGDQLKKPKCCGNWNN